MQSFLGLLAVACLFASAQGFSCSERYDGPECMSPADAQQVADNFQNLIQEYTDELANASLTPNMTEYSDSTITLINNGCTGPLKVRSSYNSILRNLAADTIFSSGVPHLVLVQHSKRDKARSLEYLINS